jgi:hypothetical protein
MSAGGCWKLDRKAIALFTYAAAFISGVDDHCIEGGGWITEDLGKKAIIPSWS